MADQLELPFVYVRPEPKKHGLENLIEGELKKGQKVVVIEDLISTGRSSLKAVEALRNEGAEVLGMAAIFTYGFSLAAENFKKAGCTLYTLSDFESLLEIAVETGYIEGNNLEGLYKWMKHPEQWTNN